MVRNKKIRLNHKEMINLALFNIGRKRLDIHHPLYHYFANRNIDGRFVRGRKEIKDIISNIIDNPQRYQHKYYDAAEIEYEMRVSIEDVVNESIQTVFEYDDYRENGDAFFLGKEKYYFGQSWGCIVDPVDELAKNIMGFEVSGDIYIYNTDNMLSDHCIKEKIRKLKRDLRKEIKRAPVNIRVFVSEKDWDEIYPGDNTVDDFSKSILSNYKNYKDIRLIGEIKNKPNLFIMIKNMAYWWLQIFIYDICKPIQKLLCCIAKLDK